ncbi:MAG: penicillin acylase family protein [Candidatus Aminicenantes bacterium]|nr:penicillin acylase family protein [Candidatus Aminicenantes bacterium]
MKIFKRILTGFIIVLLLSIIAALIFRYHIANRAIPDYNRQVELRGMKDKVTVYRDRFAVPHIYARNEEDLYRAVGYVSAQDRLWQMDLMRRATTGRLAEIFGAEFVETDLLMRSLRMSEKSNLMLKKMDPEIIPAVEAFVDGVNQFIEENKDKLPPEFAILGYEPEKWELYHSLNLAGYMAWDLTFAWDMEVLLYKLKKKIDPDKFVEMLPDMVNHDTFVVPGFSKNSVASGGKGGFFEKAPPLPPPKTFDYSNFIKSRALLPEAELDLIAALLPAAQKLQEIGAVVFDGSNNWVVSGEKSVTGKPIFANDMHLGLFAPGIWYQMHQVVEGKVNVTGVMLPGQPFIVAGHNERIAWGMTNVMVDDMDFYVEKVDPEQPHRYFFNSQWREMEVRKEKIKTKEGKVIEKELKFTHRGPVISLFHDVSDRVISMRWVGNEYSNEARSLYLVNRAGNWQEFREAMSTFISVSQNAAYADVDGNIGLQVCAGVPIRKGSAGFPVPGETDEYDWTGLVPFEDLPYIFNPESGHVSSANNRSVSGEYPYYISRWFMLPNRIDRIRELLEEKETLSIEDIKKMQADQKSKHVEKLLPGILEILQQAADLSLLEKRVLQLLTAWDGVLDRESGAALIFEKMYLVLVKNLTKDELGDEMFDRFKGKRLLIQNLILNVWRNRESGWCDNINTEVKETFPDWVLGSFRETAVLLSEEFGAAPDSWQWSKVHTFTIKHPLGSVSLLDKIFNFNRGPYEVGGSFHTVCPYSYSLAAPFKVVNGASHRHVYSTADWDKSWSIIPSGTSGIPASPFYCDQTELYVRGEYHNDFFSLEAVKKNAKFTTVISGVGGQ